MLSHPSPHGRRRREQPIQKAARLLLEERVRFLPSAVVYEVDGDHGTYQVIADGPAYRCPCESRNPLCAHVLAVVQARMIELGGLFGDAA